MNYLLHPINKNTPPTQNTQTDTQKIRRRLSAPESEAPKRNQRGRLRVTEHEEEPPFEAPGEHHKNFRGVHEGGVGVGGRGGGGGKWRGSNRH